VLSKFIILNYKREDFHNSEDRVVNCHRTLAKGYYQINKFNRSILIMFNIKKL